MRAHDRQRRGRKRLQRSIEAEGATHWADYNVGWATPRLMERSSSDLVERSTNTNTYVHVLAQQRINTTISLHIVGQATPCPRKQRAMKRLLLHTQAAAARRRLRHPRARTRAPASHDSESAPRYGVSFLQPWAGFLQHVHVRLICKPHCTLLGVVASTKVNPGEEDPNSVPNCECGTAGP